ncbi:hypothetical protein [Ramlibacter sp. 2FC]|uniref:hypothetical protein n=1 Tax=Ramlibacter sp. 2FC TaxID=2502188 RepID=UPI0010F5B05C|nr:hypothetical protein [Ramlibacter sp. 2FC]
MNVQAHLFSDDLPAPDSPPATTISLRTLKIDADRLSPAQQRFNRLLARVQKLTGQIETVRQAVDAHRPRQVRELAELEQQHSALMQRMALWLDERLRTKGLTAAQKRMATEILISLSEALAMQGDAQMQALHDRHSPDDLDAKQGASVQGMKDMLEEVLGKPLGAAGDGDDLDALLHAAMKEMDEQAQAAHEQREAQQAARRSRKAKTARQQQAEQQQTDAQSALRTLFRQLASALHPDRETDPQEHKRKSALMAEANAAYRRRDLTALLTLQLRVEQAEPGSLARMAEDKVAALNLLLKDQVAALEQDLSAVEIRARSEFGLAPYAAVNAASLARTLAQQRQQLEQDIAHMNQDLRRVQDDAEFKRWLKEQDRLARQVDPFEDLDLVFGPGGFRP